MYTVTITECLKKKIVMFRNTVLSQWRCPRGLGGFQKTGQLLQDASCGLNPRTPRSVTEE